VFSQRIRKYFRDILQGDGRKDYRFLSPGVREASAPDVLGAHQQWCPLIEGTVAQLICRVIDVHPAGDHTLYIGQVEHLGYADGGIPLLFYGGQYRTLEVQVRDYRLLNDPSWW
jgi:flavin reductase (DIM6/NTAB) family NADH-FMN oxidoreductase RutF